MTTFPGSPKLTKAALVAYRGPSPQTIVFQFNPEMLTRTLEPKTASAEAVQGEALRITGAPGESIKLDAFLDASDQLEKDEAPATEIGIHPQLALLELLLYPTSARVIANTALLALGTIEILPLQMPFVLFVWGKQRVLPVRITEFSVTEELHDPRLNPLRAKVSLGLRVLSYNDLSITHPGYYLFLGHQRLKEAMAATVAPAKVDF
jgi:hypothetical protein